MFRSTANRRAFYAKHPEIAREIRAHRRRVLLTGLGAAGAATALVASRRLVPRSLFEETGRQGVSFVSERAPKWGERTIMRLPYVGDKLRDALTPIHRSGLDWVGGEVGKPIEKVVSTIPHHVQRGHVLRAAGKAALADKTEGFSLWKLAGHKKVIQGGVEKRIPRLTIALERAEQRTGEMLTRPVTAIRKAMTDSVIPDADLKSEIDFVRTTKRRKWATDTKLAAMELRNTLSRDSAMELALADPKSHKALAAGSDPYMAIARGKVKKAIEVEARMRLAPKFPSRIERIAEKLVRPFSQIVDRADEGMHRGIVSLARRAGLPVDTVKP